MELTASARAMQEYSFQIFESFIAATLLYLMINFVIVAIMSAAEVLSGTEADRSATRTHRGGKHG